MSHSLARREFLRAVAVLGIVPAAAPSLAATEARSPRHNRRKGRHYVLVFEVVPDPNDLCVWLTSGRVASYGRTLKVCARKRDAFNLVQLRNGRPTHWAIVVYGGKSDLDQAAGGDA